MHSHKEDLAVFDVAEGIFQIKVDLPNGFELGARQLDAGFKFILDEVIVEGLAVLRNGFVVGFCHRVTSSCADRKYSTFVLSEQEGKCRKYLF